MGRRTPKCNPCDSDCCDPPTVSCSVFEDGSIAWEVSNDADEAWLVRTCPVYSDPRIDLTLAPYRPDEPYRGFEQAIEVDCTYVLHAKNRCGEVTSDCGRYIPEPCYCYNEAEMKSDVQPDVEITIAGTATSTPWLEPFIGGCAGTPFQQMEMAATYRFSCFGNDGLLFERYSDVICTTFAFGIWGDVYYYVRVSKSSGNTIQPGLAITSGYIAIEPGTEIGAGGNVISFGSALYIFNANYQRLSDNAYQCWTGVDMWFGGRKASGVPVFRDGGFDVSNLSATARIV